MSIQEAIELWEANPNSDETCRPLDKMCEDAGIHIINGKFRYNPYARIDPPVEEFYKLMGYMLSKTAKK